MSRLNLRKRKRVCYYEPEEPPFDEYVFCTDCRDYVYEYCSIHGPLLVIPDDKVPSPTGYPPLVPRAALTIPRAFLHLAVSRIPDAGIGVFSSMTLPVGVRFGPYRGTRLPPGPGSYYGWQIVDANHKPSHMVDAVDANNSNWMRYVNCSRHHSEQNLVAFQYQGQLYYRTVKVIPRFTELLVFYGGQFARQLGVDLRAYRARCGCDNCQSQLPQKSAPIKTRKRQNQLKEKPHEEKIAKENPVDKVQDTRIDSVDTLQNGDAKNAYNVPPSNKTKDDFPQKAIFKCDKCNKNFDVKTDLEKHLLTHTIEINKTKDLYLEEFKCNEYFVVNSDLEKHLQTHVLTHTGEKPFKCSHCSYTCSVKRRLLRHERTHTGEKPFKCSHCSYTCSDKSSLLPHERTHTGEKPFKCSHCSYTCTHKSNLLTHERTHTGEKPFKCSHCSYTCSVKSSLRIHERTHTGEKPFKCSHCSYTCSVKSNLLPHERTHTGEKPFKCSHCSYTCSVKSSLLSHERTHTGEKPFKCSHCSYTCSVKSSLLPHERTHTGEKPFKCSHCSYTCSVKSSLRIHERTHTGEKPFKCSHCSYTCSVKSSLRIHERTHTGEKPFKCSHCSYTYTVKSSLRTHERTHTGEKPYKCDICDYKAAYSGYIKQHLMKIHSGDKLGKSKKALQKVI